ncbi:MAG TPA: DUF488 domain-containing protein [Gemmatimonadaceae bacterium]|nr:DUF488 domain-containing protein [Gemmatimonadaceae bacterium]
MDGGGARDDTDEGERSPTLFTVGHSTRALEDFLALLEREGVRALVDVRTFPGSRRYPHFNGDALAASLAERGIGYEHAPALGGRRRPRLDSPNVAWRNAGFRGYADHMATAEFRGAMTALLDGAAARPTTVMCSEAVPWRCHRSLIADAALARGALVLHIMDAGTKPHTLTKFARVEGGEARYDDAGGAAAPQRTLFDAAAE